MRSIDDTVLEMIARRLSAMGEPTRLKILHCLMNGELSVSQLCEEIKMRPSNVSQHLSILFNAGLVGRRKEGNSVFYSIKDDLVYTICDAVCGSLRNEFLSAPDWIEKLPQH